MYKFFSTGLALIIAFHLGFPARANASDENVPIKIKVIKTKGKKAMIRVSNKYVGELPPGTYTLTKGEVEERPTGSEESRDYSISGSMDAGLFKTVTTVGTTETSTDEKTFNASFTFGWNRGRFEFGPFLSYAFRTVGTADAKTLVGGIFGDYNFTPNTEDKTWVPGLRLQAGFGQEDNSALSEAYNVTLVQAGVFVKAFYLSSNLALIPMLAYKMQMAKPTGREVKTSGVLAELGIVSYF